MEVPKLSEKNMEYFEDQLLQNTCDLISVLEGKGIDDFVQGCHLTSRSNSPSNILRGPVTSAAVLMTREVAAFLDLNITNLVNLSGSSFFCGCDTCTSFCSVCFSESSHALLKPNKTCTLH